MDAMGDLSCDVWAKSNPNTHTGFVSYLIGRHEQVGQGKYKYAIADGKGNRKVVYVSGASRRDPLREVGNCELIINEDDIIAINIMGDCAVKKNLIN